MNDFRREAITTSHERIICVTLKGIDVHTHVHDARARALPRRGPEVRGEGPLLQLERWLADFEELPLKPEVRQKIMLDNAVKLFGLEDRLAPPS
jgi:hypothetical protein